MKDRIKTIRKNNHMTQVEFGERIGVRGNTITTYENGTRVPSDAVILSICREFHISEQWLRTGTGQMFQTRSKSDEISDFIGDILSGDPDFRRRLILGLSRLNKEEWTVLEQIATKLLKEESNSKTEKPPLAMAARGGTVEIPKNFDADAFEALLKDAKTTDSL